MKSSTVTCSRPGARQPLAEYERKRDFTKTTEPSAKPARSHTEPIFVIQEHHATRLHYDFRLESGGVLKSWAVTKVPTMDASIRRLAVPTEDHPLEYAHFEGQIPKGEYGAGTVEIWDEGTYENLSRRDLEDALAAGKIEVVLHGRKLTGKFALVRMKGGGKRENWLMLKMKDQFARAGEAETPSQVTSEAPKVSGARKSVRRDRSVLPGATRKPKAGRKEPSAQAEAVASGLPFPLTHVKKVMFPEKGYTKSDLLCYYAEVAPLLLPHLRQRPMTLERLPEGVVPGGPRFWQKRTPSYYPAWIPRVNVVGADGERVNYALVNDGNALLYLVNQGTLTFHPWLSRVEDLDRPDFVLFDLDPGQKSFADLIQVAKQLHRELEAEHQPNFVKTSGKSGLHVMVPWTNAGGYDHARAWAFDLAKVVAKKLPALATVERSKAARRGRAYVDVMQNARGHHIVPPYVVRAVAAATVSTPLDWDELTSRLTPARFDIKTARKHFEKHGVEIFPSPNPTHPQSVP